MIKFTYLDSNKDLNLSKQLGSSDLIQYFNLTTILSFLAKSGELMKQNKIQDNFLKNGKLPLSKKIKVIHL